MSEFSPLSVFKGRHVSVVTESPITRDGRTTQVGEFIGVANGLVVIRTNGADNYTAIPTDNIRRVYSVAPNENPASHNRKPALKKVS